MRSLLISKMRMPLSNLPLLLCSWSRRIGSSGKETILHQKEMDDVKAVLTAAQKEVAAKTAAHQAEVRAYTVEVAAAKKAKSDAEQLVQAALSEKSKALKAKEETEQIAEAKHME